MGELMHTLLADQQRMDARIAAHTVAATTLAERQFDVQAALASLTIRPNAPSRVLTAIDRQCDEDARDQMYESISDAGIELKNTHDNGHDGDAEVVTTLIDTVRDLLECCVHPGHADKANLLRIAEVAQILAQECGE